MDRLTKPGGSYCDDCGAVSKPDEFCKEYAACRDEIAMYDRLAAYEDTELEPDRVRRLELALLSMVYQYCKVEDTNGDYLSHQWMEAGEEAFDVLGITNFSPAEDVWKRIEEAEAALGGDNA